MAIYRVRLQHQGTKIALHFNGMPSKENVIEAFDCRTDERYPNDVLVYSYIKQAVELYDWSKCSEGTYATVELPNLISKRVNIIVDTLNIMEN